MARLKILALGALSTSACAGMILGAATRSPAPAHEVRHVVSARTLRTRPPVAQDMPDSEEGWMTVLSPNQFAVLRNAATEPPGYSELTEGELEYDLKTNYRTKYPGEGAYACAGCGTPLYYARSKFNSGCGWPAFYDGIPGAIEERPDPDGSRIEIVCNSCKGHLGHVFKNEGFPTPTNERHCVNGICLKYDPSSAQPDDVEAIKGLTLGDIPM